MPDPVVNDIIEKCAKEPASSAAQISDEEIVERCIYALVNEGAKILEEGIAHARVRHRPDLLNGYGFPAWRGGPMFHADTVGLTKVYERICEFHAQHGELWTPAPLLKRLVDEGKAFKDFAPARPEAHGDDTLHRRSREASSIASRLLRRRLLPRRASSSQAPRRGPSTCRTSAASCRCRAPDWRRAGSKCHGRRPS